MKYLKCNSKTGQFVDPSTRVKIGRGEIVLVKKVTDNMKRSLMDRGLIEVSEEEFNQWVESKNPIKPLEVSEPAKVIPEPVLIETDTPLVLDEEETEIQSKSKKLNERFKKNKPSKE